MPRRVIDRDLHGIAFHEAGHVAMALHVGKPGLQVMAWLAEEWRDGELHSGVTVTRNWTCGRRELALHSFAGAVASWHHLPGNDFARMSRSDWNNATYHGRYPSGDAYMRKRFAECDRLITGPLWRKVCALARELIEHRAVARYIAADGKARPLHFSTDHGSRLSAIREFTYPSYPRDR